MPVGTLDLRGPRFEAEILTCKLGRACVLRVEATPDLLAESELTLHLNSECNEEECSELFEPGGRGKRG